MISYDKDADLGKLDGKTVAILGYGSQGHAHALNLKDSGVDVVVGLREDSSSVEKAKSDGLRVTSIADAASEGDVVIVLLPVAGQGGQDERGAGAQVADLDVLAVEPGRSGDRRVMGVADVDLGAHPGELAEELEAVLEDRLVDPARAGRLGQQHAGRRLEVGRQARIRRGLDVDRPVPAARRAAPATSIVSPPQRTPTPDPLERLEERRRGARTARPRASRARRSRRPRR